MYKRLFLLIFLSLSGIAAVAAEEIPAESRYVQILERCRHPDWNSTKQLNNRQALLLTRQENNCLKQYITEQLSKLFDNEKTRSQALQDFDMAQKAYVDMYNLVYNNNYTCNQGKGYYDCGENNVSVAETLWNQQLKIILNNLLLYQNALSVSEKNKIYRRK